MTRPFVNRVEEIRVLKQALNYDNQDNPVLVFTGIGGMGKTALRTAFEEHVLKPNKVPYAIIDYDGDPNLRPIEATLRAMRRQLGRQGVRTPVFDYLYARYFELSMGVKISSKNCPPELEGVVTILEGLPGVGQVTQIIHGLTQLGLVVKERLQHKEWLYRLRDLEPREVLNLLPEVLAEDLEEAVTSQSVKILKSLGYRIPLILDAYERLAESQLDDTLHRKLLLCTPHLLRVIFTRDPFPWEHKFPKEWCGKIRHFPSLDDLSREDATVFLRKKGVDNPDLQDHLYQLTGGYPFHLELCADICGEIVESGQEPGVSDFEGLVQAHDLTEELVARLLRQLAPEERDLMGLAAYPRWVSEEILEELSSIPESVPRIFKKFMGLSMFSPNPEIPEAYTLRKEVRDCLLSQHRHEHLFKQRHEKLSQFHKERWQETQLYHYLREALYHGFYENPDEAIKIFDEYFENLFEKCRYGVVEGLLEAVPIETLDEEHKRKIDYARARLLTSTAHSKDSLLTAKILYESLIASEKEEKLLAKYFIYIGDILRYMGEYRKALEFHQKGLNILAKRFGKGHPEIVDSYLTIGTVYFELGEYGKALEFAQNAITIEQKAYGDKHSRLAKSYNFLGLIYVEKAEYGKALEYFKKSINIWLKIYGLNHPKLANPYCNIGLVHYYQGEYKEALEHFEKSLNIFLKVYGEEHIHVAEQYNNISVIYEELCEYKKALEFSKKSFTIWSKIYGEGHPRVAASYFNIGNVYYSQGKNKKALDYFQKSLSIWRKSYKEEHPLVARAYHGIGKVFCRQEEYGKAMEYHTKGLTINLKVCGEVHPYTSESYNEIAIVYREKGNYKKALEYFMKRFDIFQKIYGSEHPDIARTHNDMGIAYRKMGEYKKALELYQKAISIFLKVHGEKHLDVARTYKEIAFTLWALKREEVAIEKMQQSAEIYRKIKLWKDAVEVLETLAGWLEEKGRNKEAEEARAEIQKIRKEHGLSQEGKK